MQVDRGGRAFSAMKEGKSCQGSDAAAGQPHREPQAAAPIPAKQQPTDKHNREHFQMNRKAEE